MAARPAMKYLRWLGLLLSIVALAYIGFRFRDYGRQVADLQLSPQALAGLVLLGVLYGLANLPLAAAWRNLLEYLGERRDFAWAFRVYGQSQLAKYIPGNVFHIAGRQALGMADGAATGRLARSAAWEIGVIAISGACFAALVVAPGDILVSVSAFVLLLAALGALAARFLSASVARAIGWYVLFLLLSGLLFYAVIKLLEPAAALRATTVVAAYVLAWLAGMLTPGAPAGVGVREVVLYGLLHTGIGQAELLVAIVLGRLVTAGGDLLFYLAAVFSPAGKPAHHV